MKKNMGVADKGIRLLVSGILAVLYFMGAIEGVFGIVLLVVAIIFAATSFISFCPLYTILGISTAQKKEKHAPPQTSQHHKHHHKR